VTNDKQRVCRQQGFTLVEVIIALFVFMIIAIGVMQGEVAALRTQTDNLLRDEAVRLAEERLNDLRARPPAVAPGDAWGLLEPLNKPVRNGAVAFVQMARGMDTTAIAIPLTRIEVAVGWNQGNNRSQLAPTNCNHQVVLNTIVIGQ